MTDKMIKFVMERAMTPIKIDKNIHIRGTNPGKALDHPHSWFSPVSAKPHLKP
jgi:hypothetical protein